MASGFSASLLRPRGIRSSTNSMILNPESDVMPPSPRRKSRAGSIVRKRLSSVSSKLGKKKRTPPPPEEAPPEQAPSRAITVRPKVKKSPLLQWMERQCPQDVVPKILAFCGPQTTASLFQSNRRLVIDERFVGKRNPDISAISGGLEIIDHRRARDVQSSRDFVLVLTLMVIEPSGFNHRILCGSSASRPTTPQPTPPNRPPRRRATIRRASMRCPWGPFRSRPWPR